VFAAFCQALAQFRDYRAGPITHPLFSLRMILVLSTLAGCRGWDASADWARAHFELLRRYLDLWPTPPSADTLRRTAQAYDLDNILGDFGTEGATVHRDGKRARGATRDDQVDPFIEALGGERVIGMVETGAGAEAPALEALVGALDLAGRLVTIDAAGTTRRSTTPRGMLTEVRTWGMAVMKRAARAPSPTRLWSLGCPRRPKSKTSAVCARSAARALPQRALSQPSTILSAAGVCARARRPGVSGPMGALRPGPTSWRSG
jgi:hypothetical protein